MVAIKCLEVYRVCINCIVSINFYSILESYLYLYKVVKIAGAPYQIVSNCRALVYSDVLELINVCNFVTYHLY